MGCHVHLFNWAGGGGACPRRYFSKFGSHVCDSVNAYLLGERVTYQRVWEIWYPVSFSLHGHPFAIPAQASRPAMRSISLRTMSVFFLASHYIPDVSIAQDWGQPCRKPSSKDHKIAKACIIYRFFVSSTLFAHHLFTVSMRHNRQWPAHPRDQCSTLRSRVMPIDGP